jgi:hypothetical protein
MNTDYEIPIILESKEEEVKKKKRVFKIDVKSILSKSKKTMEIE